MRRNVPFEQTSAAIIVLLIFLAVMNIQLSFCVAASSVVGNEVERL